MVVVRLCGSDTELSEPYPLMRGIKTTVTLRKVLRDVLHTCGWPEQRRGLVVIFL